jgi:hypothetical protein
MSLDSSVTYVSGPYPMAHNYCVQRTGVALSQSARWQKAALRDPGR